MMTPRSTHRVLASLCVAAFLSSLVTLAACQGAELGPDEPGLDVNGEPCTDPVRCCPKEMLRCEGDPDTGVICTCSDLWTCSKDPSKCKQPNSTPNSPTPPSGWSKPKPGQECVPGQKKWCDGELYCGWGQVECTAQGTWKREASGELECLERADGRVPNTTCACYYFFFDEKCCETPDCIVPKGTNGQLCPKSPGKLCDYCNPHNPECLPGGLCVVALDETYCGRDCSAAQPCPAGYSCTLLLQKLKFVHQCVPNDGSCYQ